MVIFASADLVRNLTAAAVIDEYRVQVHPVVLGTGKPLLAGVPQRTPLRLANTKAYPGGSVLLTYQRT